MAAGTPRRVFACIGAVLLPLGMLAGTTAANGGGPVVTSVRPATVTPGATLTVAGSNFGNQQPGSEVAFVGPQVTVPAAVATIVSWSPTSITVQAPAADLWPGTAEVEVLTPAWDAPSNGVAVTVVAPGGAITGPEAAWRGDPAAAAAGAIDVGWYDAAGTSTGPITLALPTATPAGTAAFSVPATLPPGSVTLNGAQAGAEVGSGSVTWPDGSSTAAALISIARPAGATPSAGPVQIAISEAAGITAADGVYPLAAAAGGATAALTLQVAPNAVAGYEVTVPATVPAGSPFPVDVQAVDAGGQPVASAAGTVYLSSVDGMVDFRGARQALDGPATAAVDLKNGTAEVIAVASVAGPTTIAAADAAGLSGSAPVQIAAPAAGAGLRLQIFPAFSGYADPTAVYAAADVDTLGRQSGVRLNPAGGGATAYGGWWPNDPGQPYEAQWTGVLTVRAPGALPAPLPQPMLQFALLNVAAEGGTASLSPIAGTGATINGSGMAASIATAADGTGWTPPSVLALTPGQYALTVQASEDAADGGSGDTLYYSEAYQTAVGTGVFAAPASVAWSPLTPLPPAAFTAGGLPDGALAVPIGAASVDDAGAPVALVQPAQIQNGRTLLPLRAVAEMLGARVDWEPATQGITVTGPTATAQLTVGSANATVNGAAVTLDQPAVVVPPGVTLVPLRFLGQALGWQVAWDGTRSTAVLLPPLSAAVPTHP